ncbi:hypothetical protein JHK85_018305 [Glycine max]|nr:hypothetical protein JHK85_018305 [Glycine max]
MATIPHCSSGFFFGYLVNGICNVNVTYLVVSWALIMDSFLEKLARSNLYPEPSDHVCVISVVLKLISTHALIAGAGCCLRVGCPPPRPGALRGFCLWRQCFADALNQVLRHAMFSPPFASRLMGRTPGTHVLALSCVSITVTYRRPD